MPFCWPTHLNPRRIRSREAPEEPGPHFDGCATEARAPAGPGASGLPQLARSPNPQPLTPRPRQERSRSPEPEVSPPATSPPVVTSDAPITTASNTGSSPDHPAEIAPLAATVLEPAHIPTGPNLTGVWLLLPSPHVKTDGLYPPDYIELTLTEQSGILHGRYRARYHIPDQAIPPTVSFQFEGQVRRGSGQACLGTEPAGPRVRSACGCSRPEPWR